MWYKNNTVFNSQQSIRNDNPNSSLPHFMSDEVIAELGYVKVVDVVPTYNADTQYVVAGEVIEVNGIPTKQYTVVDYTAEELQAMAKAKVPQVVTPRQARLALLQVGLLDEVDLATKANKAHEVYWEYSLEVKRDDALLIELATVLGMTDAQLDDLFVLANTL